MGLGPTIIATGNVQSTFILSVSLTPVAVAANSTVEQSFTINGLSSATDQVSDVSYIGGAWSVNVSLANYRVSANNTLTVSYSNPTGGSVTPPSGTYYVEINRIYSGLTMSTIQ
jgi:hypothetical protein